MGSNENGRKLAMFFVVLLFIASVVLVVWLKLQVVDTDVANGSPEVVGSEEHN